MNRIVIATLAGLIAAPVLAADVDRIIDAAADGRIDISNIAGSVTIRGWSRNAVEVTGTLGRNVEELIFERNGDKVIIKVKVPRRGGRGIDSKLNINVPRNSSLDVGTVSADIDVEHVNGDQSLISVSGDVDTEHTGADIQIESVSGNIEIVGDGAEGEIEVSTVSGDVTLFRVAGRASADSVSGDVIVDEGTFSRVDLGSVSGNIVFQAALGEGGRLDIGTINGSVDVEFIGKVSARFEVETFNGGIRNCFGPKAKRRSKFGPGLELEFTEGEGDGRVEISTMNGNVNICRQ